MCHTTADLPKLPPSTAHEDIRRALADVEVRLSAWAAAMDKAQAALTVKPPVATATTGAAGSDASTSCGERIPGPVTVSPEPVAPKAVAGEVKASEPKASKPKASEPKAIETKASEPKASDKASELKASEPKASDKASEPKASGPVVNKTQGTKPTPEKPPAPKRKPRAAPPVKPPDPEDEALLASLDPETAKAIRIHRRLSPDNKSVRQLLEEIKTRSGREPAEERRKSWWSRG